MLKNCVIALAASASLGSASLAQEQSPSARLTDIRAQLLYERSGTLSVDISDNKEFVGWNTIIGEGSALEPANDLLVAAILESNGEAYDNRTLTVRVRSAENRILAKRSFNGIYADGKVHQYLYLKDAGCAGVITITATLGRQTRTEKVILECGE